MNALQRQKEILKNLEMNGFNQVTELSRLFQVSEVTIRSDLRALEQKGFVERKHGGVILKENENINFSFSSKALVESKVRIASAALSCIEEGDSIFLDASSTSWHFALQLRNKKNLTIISNSIPIFEIFKDYKDGELIGIPGKLNPASQSFIGPFAENMIKNLRTNKAFISPKAILPDGLRDNGMLESSIRKCMIDSAEKTIVIADYSKFGNNGIIFGIDSLDQVDTVVTDHMPSDEYLKKFKEKNIELRLAEQSVAAGRY